MTITLEKINKAREIGASDDQIFEAIKQYDPDMYSRVEKARAIGASNEQIMKGIESRLANVKQIDISQPTQNQQQAQNQPEEPGFFDRIGNAFRVGAGESVSGLIQEVMTGKKGPKFKEDPGFIESIAAMAGTLFGDAPYIGAGASLGGAAGGAVGGIGGSVIPVLGTSFGAATGTTVGGTAGALALPAFLKSAMHEYLDYRSKGNDITFGEFLQSADRIASDTLKEGANGFILGNIGKLIPMADKIPGLDKLLSYKPARKAAEIALETTALGALPPLSAFQLPEANDFATGLALALGFKLPEAVFAAKSRYEKYIKDNKIAERELTNEKIKEISEKVKSGVPEEEALNDTLKPEEAEKPPEIPEKKEILAENEKKPSIESSKLQVNPKPLTVKSKQTKEKSKPDIKDISVGNFVLKEERGENSAKIKVYPKRLNIVEKKPSINLKKSGEHTAEVALPTSLFKKIEGKNIYNENLVEINLNNEELKLANKIFELKNEKSKTADKKKKQLLNKQIQDLENSLSENVLKRINEDIQNEKPVIPVNKSLRSKPSAIEILSGVSKSKMPVIAKPAGVVGDYIKSEKVRKAFKDILDYPVQVQKHELMPKNKETEANSFGYYERGLPIVYSDQAKSPVNAILHEGIHLLQDLKNRLQDLHEGKLKDVKYNDLPFEKTASEFVKWAAKNEAEANKNPKSASYKVKPKPLVIYKNKPVKKISKQSGLLPQPITEVTGLGAEEKVDFTQNKTERIINATNRAIEVIKNPKKHIIETGQAINEGVFNFLAPLERLEKDIPIEDRPSVFIDRALSANSTINAIIENGIFSDITGQLEHQGLKDAYGTDYVWRTRTRRMKSPDEASLQEVSIYRTAKQALKRQSEGKPTGIDTQLAQETVDRLRDKYDEVSERIRQFQRGVTSTYGKDLLGQDGIAYWNKDYYSPMYRVMDTGNDAMLSNNSLNPKKPWFKFKGSERFIIDPKESDVYNTAMLVQNDLKNQAVLKYREGVINGSLPGKIVKATISEIPEPIVRDLVQKGLDLNDPVAVAQATKLYNQTRANSFNPANNTLRGWIDGKPFDIIVPEEVGRVFKGIEPQQRPYYARFFDFFNRAFNKQFRIDPQKFTSITARDLLNATIWGRSGISPKTSFKAMGEAIFGSDAYKQFLQEGGDSYAARFATRLDRSKSINEFVTPGYEGPVYPLSKFMDFLQAVGKKQDAMAIAVPFQEYMKGIEKYGNTPAGRVKAMYDAKRVTYNPNRKGGSRIVREIAPFINWFNISLQDMAMNAHNLKKPEVWARAATIITLPTLALKMANSGNPDYDNLTMEDKFGYWHIFAGDTHYRIALPWLMGTLFKVVPEAIYESSVNDNHKDALAGVFNNFVDQTTGSLNPLLRAFVVTSTGKTPAEWFGFRTKAPEVVPKRLQNLPPEYQFTQNTSQLSRGIGSALGISPMIADRVAQELGGTISKRTLSLIDEIAYQTGIADDKRPEKQISDYVSIGNFITDSTPNRTKYTQKFYELWNEYETTKAAIKIGVPEKSIERFGNIANMKKRIDRGVREYRDIEQSDLNKSEKREALKEKQLELNALYKEAVENITE